MKTGIFKGRLKLVMKSPFEKSQLIRASVQAAYTDKETGAQEPVSCMAHLRALGDPRRSGFLVSWTLSGDETPAPEQLS